MTYNKCAYDCLELVSNFNGKFEESQSYGSKLLLGCSDGSLRIYSPKTESCSSDRSKPCLRRNLLVSRRSLLFQWKLLNPESSFYQSIAFHRLSSLETIAVITKAK
ncbi:Vam6/Vps39-like protein, partial [Trifolium pratense]